MKTVFNILGCIIAFFLSIILICNLLLLPILQGVTGLLQPRVLEAIIEEIDPESLLTAAPDLTQALVESGINEEAARALLESGVVAEVLQSVAGDALKALQGEFVQPSLTQDALKELVHQHREELLEVVLLMAPPELSLNMEGANLLLDQLVTEQSGVLIDTINDAMVQLQQEMQAQNITAAIMLFTKGVVTAVLIGFAVVLAGLIFLCRLRHAEGFVWIGVDAILAALPTFGAGKLMTGTFLLSQLPTGAIGTTLLPVLRRTATSVFIGSAILMGVGILCIILFVLLRKRRMKKAAAAQAALPVVEEETPVV